MKATPEDFRVTEVLGFEPCGEGEHIFLWLQKQNLNTAFVAEALAKFTGLPLRNISYAGRKDKHAITEQWFGVHLPGKTDPDWSKFSLDGAQILRWKRHNKKLRVGVLRGNRFVLTLRDVSDCAEAERRLQLIADEGVPNYFGEQRFGNHQSNLTLGLRMLEGEAIRNRNRRNLAISALRAYLFNQFVSARVQQQRLSRPFPGDVMLLSGSNSFFVAEVIDEPILARLRERDISISAPMWGAGELAAREEALAFEQSVVQQHQNVADGLIELGLSQERRSVHLRPQQLQWQWQGNTLTLSFELPAGCFATSVVRELLIQPESPENSDENPTQQ